MKNRMIKAAAVVPKLVIANAGRNADEIVRMIKENSDCGIIVFPELSVTGYTCADLFGNSLLLDEAEKALKTIADSTAPLKGLCAVVGLPLRVDGDLYNCAAFVSGGKVKGIVPKSCIPNYSEFYEERWFTSGAGISGAYVQVNKESVPFGTDLLFEDVESGAVIGAEICEDAWVPDKPGTHACLAGANIIVNPSASDELIGKQEYRRNLVAQRSADCYCGYVYVSSGTDESSTDLVFSGHSMIACDGKILTEGIFSDGAEVRTALIDLEQSEYNRRHANTYMTREKRDYRRISVGISPVFGKNEISVDELEKALTKEDHHIAPNPFVPSDSADRAKRCKRILEIQANGLATRVRHTGIKNLVIGVSGGLDSTLALIVCNEARKLVPDIRIIAYTMPNTGNTSSRTYNNAVALMKVLGAEAREIAIGEDVGRHLAALGHGEAYQGEGDVTYENAQARMRTYILMDAANMENGLVVGTGDLSELALGWCTYNGDHMSMYGVNASVPKTLVRYICGTYAMTCSDETLKSTLLDIIDTPITPELTPGKDGEIAQKTEEKIGKYDLNDFFLYHTLRYGSGPEKIMAFAMKAYPSLGKEAVREALLRFTTRFFRQQFKRSCLPDGPKVGSVTLSPRGDWRMPSDADVNMWIDAIRNA